jgi:hypothetical protein
MYNSVRGYVSAVNELWSQQVSRGLHNAPKPDRVAMKALKTSIARREHMRRRAEFADRGIATIQDGYTATQIPDLHKKAWELALGGASAEMSLRTAVDFLFGNTMLLRSSNRLPMELPDLFLMPLPREGLRGDAWCMVMVTDQGMYISDGLRMRTIRSLPGSSPKTTHYTIISLIYLLLLYRKDKSTR